MKASPSLKHSRSRWYNMETTPPSSPRGDIRYAASLGLLRLSPGKQSPLARVTHTSPLPSLPPLPMMADDDLQAEAAILFDNDPNDLFRGVHTPQKLPQPHLTAPNSTESLGLCRYLTPAKHQNYENYRLKHNNHEIEAFGITLTQTCPQTFGLSINEEKANVLLGQFFEDLRSYYGNCLERFIEISKKWYVGIYRTLISQLVHFWLEKYEPESLRDEVIIHFNNEENYNWFGCCKYSLRNLFLVLQFNTTCENHPWLQESSIVNIDTPQLFEKNELSHLETSFMFEKRYVCSIYLCDNFKMNPLRSCPRCHFLTVGGSNINSNYPEDDEPPYLWKVWQFDNIAGGIAKGNVFSNPPVTFYELILGLGTIRQKTISLKEVDLSRDNFDDLVKPNAGACVVDYIDEPDILLADKQDILGGGEKQWKEEVLAATREASALRNLNTRRSTTTNAFLLNGFEHLLFSLVCDVAGVFKKGTRPLRINSELKGIDIFRVASPHVVKPITGFYNEISISWVYDQTKPPSSCFEEGHTLGLDTDFTHQDFIVVVYDKTSSHISPEEFQRLAQLTWTTLAKSSEFLYPVNIILRVIVKLLKREFPSGNDVANKLINDLLKDQGCISTDFFDDFFYCTTEYGLCYMNKPKLSCSKICDFMMHISFLRDVVCFAEIVFFGRDGLLDHSLEATTKEGFNKWIENGNYTKVDSYRLIDNISLGNCTRGWFCQYFQLDDRENKEVVSFRTNSWKANKNQDLQVQIEQGGEWIKPKQTKPRKKPRKTRSSKQLRPPRPPRPPRQQNQSTHPSVDCVDVDVKKAVQITLLNAHRVEFEQRLPSVKGKDPRTDMEVLKNMVFIVAPRISFQQNVKQDTLDGLFMFNLLPHYQNDYLVITGGEIASNPKLTASSFYFLKSQNQAVVKTPFFSLDLDTSSKEYYDKRAPIPRCMQPPHVPEPISTPSKKNEKQPKSSTRKTLLSFLLVRLNNLLQKRLIFLVKDALSLTTMSSSYFEQHNLRIYSKDKKEQGGRFLFALPEESTLKHFTLKRPIITTIGEQRREVGV